MAFKFICFEKNVPRSDRPLLASAVVATAGRPLGLESVAAASAAAFDPYAPS